MTSATACEPASAPTLRPYQEAQLDAIATALASGLNRVLIQAATGTGKTVTFAALLQHPPIAHWLAQWERRGAVMLVVAHREELLEQSAAAIRVRNPDLFVEIEQADRSAGAFADVIVASIQTLTARKCRRLRDLLQRHQPRVVVADEAHHGSAPSWRTALVHLGFLPSADASDEENVEAPSYEDVAAMTAALAEWDTRAPKDRLLVGVTATPNRTDAIGLSCVFQTLAYSYPLRAAIADRWLVPIVPWVIETQHSLDGVGLTAGEFNQRQLAEAVNTAARNQIAVAAWREHAEGRQTLAFTVDVAHAHALAEAFQAAGVTAVAVSGETPRDERRASLDDFRRGRVSVIANCAVFCLDEQTEILTSEGWVGIDDMTYEHRVANWDDGRIVFDHPQFIIRRPRAQDEGMVSYASARQRFRVTPDHRMIVRESGVWVLCHAKDIVGGQWDVPICGIAEPFDVAPPPEDAAPSCTPARRVNSLAYAIRTRGGDPATSHGAAARMIAERVAVRRKTARELSVAECEFIGFWIGDGSATRLKRGGVEYTATQALRYPDIIKWFEGVIRGCGFHSIKRFKKQRGGHSDYYTWSFARGTGFGSQRRAGLYPIEPFLVKGPNPLLWGLNVEQFEGLIRGFAYADGPHSAGRRSYEIGGTALELFDQLQAIAVCRGFCASIHSVGIPQRVWHRPQATLRIGPWQSRRIGAGSSCVTSERAWVPERVWCVTSTTGNIVTRRGGHVTVTGNTEGTDLPMVSCVLQAKPTKSATLFEQMAGRGLRPHLGKSDCVLIDLVDTARRHSLQTAAVLYGLPPGLKAQGRALNLVSDDLEALREQFPGFSIDEALRERPLTLAELQARATKVDIWAVPALEDRLRAATRLNWMTQDAGRYRLQYPWAEGTEVVTVEPNLLGQYDIVSTYRPRPQQQVGGRWRILPTTQHTVTRNIATAGQALVTAEQWMTANRPEAATLKRASAPWRAKPASEKQVALLVRLRIPFRRPLTCGEASDLIDLAHAKKGR